MELSSYLWNTTGACVLPKQLVCIPESLMMLMDRVGLEEHALPETEGLGSYTKMFRHWK